MSVQVEARMNPQGRSFGIPALYSMQSLQQVVMTSGSVGALPTVVTMVPCQQPNLTTLSALPQNPPAPPPPPQPITTAPTPKPASPPTPQLYLCRTSNNATGLYKIILKIIFFRVSLLYTSLWQLVTEISTDQYVYCLWEWLDFILSLISHFLWILCITIVITATLFVFFFFFTESRASI